MDKLGIDYTNPNFDIQTALVKFTEAEKNATTTFEKQKMSKIVKLCSKHQFWETEKINNPLKKCIKEGVIEKIDVKKYKESQPTPLPEGFEWDTLDPTDEAQMDELSEFLNFHYVESEGADFRLAQSTKMLQWAYMIPGYKKEQFIVIRN